MTRLFLMVIIIQVQRAANSPLRMRRSPRDIGTLPPQPILISTLQTSGSRLIPVFAQDPASHSVTVLPQHLIFKNDGHNVPLVAPIPLSQFFFHSKVQLIPRPNVIHNIHVQDDNVKIPVISHHSVSHMSQNANVTHSTSVVPLYIHRHIIPVHHDLSVIPLQRHHKVEKLGHYRMEKNADEDEEPSNRFRKYYGGHGSGLFFGGHGSGHGFYAYGK